MKYLLIISLLLVTTCTSSSELEEGRWKGHITPMNHPDMSIPVSYDINHVETGLKISIIGSNGIPVVAQNPHLKEDTLFFVFNEPEEQVPLKCALARSGVNKFSGKCTDSTGKWAQFTMIPPS